MSGYAVPPPPPAATRGGVVSEVEAELQGQMAPLEADAAGYERASTRAVEDLNALFAGIMPFVAGSAQRVAEQYGATNKAQASIFDQAWQRLNSLRGERAAEAQALAQQIGAPVPLDAMMTKGITSEMGNFVPEAAGELLKASTIGQAGVQQAEAFAGRVMPLMQARQTREVKNYYRDQITDLKKQITTLKSMKPGLVNERLRARQLEDYEMRLARAEALFSREQTKRSLKLEEKRLAAQLEEIRGNQKLAKKELTQRKNESDRDFALRLRQQNMDAATRKANNNSYVNAQKQNIVTLSNALARPGAQQIEEKVLIRQPDGTLSSETVTKTIKGQQLRNPTVLLNAILAQSGVTRGQKELYGFAVKQVIAVLKTMGLNPPADPKKWASWWKKRQGTKGSTVSGYESGPPGTHR